MMFKINLNKIFFSFALITFFWWNFLFADYFIKEDNLSLFLVWLHVSIATNTFWLSNTTDQNWVLSLLKDVKLHSTTSIVSMLEFTAMKEIVLDGYLNHTSNLLNNVWLTMTTLRQDIALLESDMNECIAQKDLYDRQFFQSIDLYDQKSMDESLQKSIDAEKCIWENRIKMTAKTVLFDQFSSYYDFIKTKYDYLILKRDLIIRNFDFMKNGMLDELITTKEVLNTLGN